LLEYLDVFEVSRLGPLLNREDVMRKCLLTISAVVALVTVGSSDSNIVQAETSAAKPRNSPQVGRQGGRHRSVSHPGRGDITGKRPETTTQVTRRPFPEIVHPESGS
jgi:hypothetical protein